MSFTEQQIREKAYELWISRGSRQGFAVQDWADAEKHLAQLHQPAPVAAPAPAPVAEEPAKASGKGKGKSSSTPAPASSAASAADDVKYGLKKMS
jgi:hypothetical protein